MDLPPLKKVWLDVNDSASISTNHNETIFYTKEYYSLMYRIVGTIVVSVIFVVGSVGNVMVVIVVAKCRSMRSPTNCYLMSLATADLLLLLTATLPTIVENYLIIDQHVYGNAGCNMMIFLQYLGVNVSTLTITALSVERYIAICHPMRAQSICTYKRAQKIIAGLWVFCLGYSCPWLALTRVQSKSFTDGTSIDYCTFKLPRHSYLTYYMIDLLVLYLIPLSINCVLYASIAYALFAKNSFNRDISSHDTFTNDAVVYDSKSVPVTRRYFFRNFKKRQSTLNSASTRLTNANSVKTSAEIHASNKRVYVSMNSTQASVNSRVQVIKMLAIVVCLFAALWLPYRALVVYNSFAPKRYESVWFMLFCRCLVYANSAVNPILYNVMSVKFRRAFKRLLLSCCRLCCSARDKRKATEWKGAEVPPKCHVIERRDIN